jgi:hypothetical protein
MNRRTIADKRGEELEEIVQQIGREARGEWTNKKQQINCCFFIPKKNNRFKRLFF